MDISTCDLSDEFDTEVQVAEPLFRNFGARPSFGGPIAALRVFEDNSLVREAAESAGEGRVLVVDGGGSLKCSMVGDEVAQAACDNGWAGMVINGAIRDSVAIAGIAIGIKALNTIPRKSIKRGEGERDLTVHFAGISFEPGHYLYSDEDGIVVAPRDLLA